MPLRGERQQANRRNQTNRRASRLRNATAESHVASSCGQRNHDGKKKPREGPITVSLDMR